MDVQQPHRRSHAATTSGRKRCIINVTFPPPGQALSLLTFILWTASLVELCLARGGHASYRSSALVCDAAAVGADGSIRPPTSIITNGQLTSYRQDGFIRIRGVLDEVLLEKMARSGRAIADRAAKYPQFFSVVENGLIFDGGGLTISTAQLSESTAPSLDVPSNSSSDTTHPCGTLAASINNDDVIDAAAIFRMAAIYSHIPQIAAELMELDPQTQNLRILRDIFLAKPVNGSGCDWHVDDHGFWPESYLSDASKQSGKDQDGVNVWISLVDMPAMYGGSMALSAGSHKEPWRYEAFEAIGQNRTVDGGHTKESIIARMEEKRRTGKIALGACEIEKVRPDLKAKMDEKKVIMDVKRGDVIFSTRLLWHKTMDVTDEGKEYYASLGLEVLNRYSIRYTPGTARLPKGWLAEWSAVSDPENPGSSLNDIVNRNGGVLWYPQVWPTPEDNMDLQLNLVADTELDPAKQKVKAEIAELFTPKLTAVTPPSDHQADATTDRAVASTEQS